MIEGARKRNRKKGRGEERINTLHPSFFSIKALQPGHGFTRAFINDAHSSNCAVAASSDSLYVIISEEKDRRRREAGGRKRGVIRRRDVYCFFCKYVRASSPHAAPSCRSAMQWKQNSNLHALQFTHGIVSGLCWKKRLVKGNIGNKEHEWGAIMLICLCTLIPLLQKGLGHHLAFGSARNAASNVNLSYLSKSIKILQGQTNIHTNKKIK